MEQDNENKKLLTKSLDQISAERKQQRGRGRRGGFRFGNRRGGRKFGSRGGRSRPRKTFTEEQKEETKKRLFIKGLSKEVTNAQLKVNIKNINNEKLFETFFYF